MTPRNNTNQKHNKSSARDAFRKLHTNFLLDKLHSVTYSINTMINQKSAVDGFLKGVPAIVLTYHSAKAETVNYRDKVTHQAAQFKSLRHTCLTDDGAVVWQERVPDNFNAETYQSPYKKGQRILVKITSLQSSQGVMTISGAGDLLSE